MRRLSQVLMFAGLLLGGAVALAMAMNWSWPGATWLVNVALAKLTIIAALGLLTAGAVTGRIAQRQASRSHESHSAV